VFAQCEERVSVKKGSQGAIMLLCFYAHPVRSGVVCEGLSETGDRQVWNGEDNALCLSCLWCRSDVRTSLRTQVGFTPLCRLWGLFSAVPR
jgi:hypothetical protein